MPLGWLVLGALALSAIAGLGLLWWTRERAAERPPDPQKLHLRLDINRASSSELQLLPGIGASRATRIVRARERRGGFRSLSELDEREVLGPGAARRLAPYLLPLDAGGDAASKGGSR
jgi:hypothetical protein